MDGDGNVRDLIDPLLPPPCADVVADDIGVKSYQGDVLMAVPSAGSKPCLVGKIYATPSVGPVSPERHAKLIRCTRTGQLSS